MKALKKNSEIKQIWVYFWAHSEYAQYAFFFLKT